MQEVRRQSPGFTLIELMVVIAIMGILFAIGVPAIFKSWRKESMRKATSDLMDACQNARALAILQDKKATLVFYPLQRRFQVDASSVPKSPDDVALEDGQSEQPVAGKGMGAKLPDDVAIEMLDVNLHEYKEAPEAQVNFYPNGTCDEMTVVLHSTDDQWRKISLEITTGLATFESDPQKF